MPDKICEDNICTGCNACVNVCPKHCISMKENIYGELHPYIDNTICINCGLCKNTCPNNINQNFHYPQKCYASWIDDVKKRKICASGGIGTILSEYVIKSGGVVFGSRYDNNLNPIITYTELLDELENFKGSRYVQSSIGNETFKKVLSFLVQGRLVLYIGTPCQIGGLLSYLKKDYENLITVDLICHGVSPTKYFRDEVNYLTQKYNLTDVVNARFRGNDRNNYILSLWNSKKERIFPRKGFLNKLFLIDSSQQYYIQGFLLGVSLRENCYTCQYAKPERISDITIGDFIGLGTSQFFQFSKNNVSSVLINTNKGGNLYKEISESNISIRNIEREYSERLQYKPSLIEPYKRHNLNKKFKEEYIKKGYVKSIRSVLFSYMLIKKIKALLNYWRLIYKIPIRFAKNILF